MSDEQLVHIEKRRTRRKKPTIVNDGWWDIDPPLHEITRNWASREGFYLLSFIEPDHKRGRHERIDI